MRFFSLALALLAACGGGAARPASPAPPPGSQTSPEDLHVAALVAEVNASSVGDCSVEYRSAGDGSGSGLILFHGVERHSPPSPAGPPAQITSHASLQTERYRSPADVETAERERRSEFDACMRQHPEDDRVRKGMSVRVEACRVSLLPYSPTAHYEDRFSVVRRESSGDRFFVPEECRDALAKLEARLTPYVTSR